MLYFTLSKKVTLTSLTAFPDLQRISTRTNITYIFENKKKKVRLCTHVQKSKVDLAKKN